MAWVEGKRGRRIAFKRPYKLTKWQKKAKKAVIGFLYTFYTFIFLYKDWAFAHFVSFRIMSFCRWRSRWRGQRPDHGTRASPSRVTCQKPRIDQAGLNWAQVRQRSKIVWRDHSTHSTVFCPLHSTRHGTRSKINSKNLPSASLFKDSKLRFWNCVVRIFTLLGSMDQIGLEDLAPAARAAQVLVNLWNSNCGDRKIRHPRFSVRYDIRGFQFAKR